MSLSEIVEIVASIAGVVLLWQQNQIFKQQNVIFAEQAERSSMPETSKPKFSIQRYWPMLTMALMMFATWAGIAVDASLHKAHFNRTAALQLVTDKAFRDERVEIDGKEFRNCAFDEVTLVYDGRAPFKFVGNKFSSTLMITTNDPSVGTTIGLLSALGFMPDVIRYSDEPVTAKRVDPAVAFAVGQNMQLISDQTFDNETVELDGKRFEHCVFKKVEFLYDGRQGFAMSHVTFATQPIVIRTHSGSAFMLTRFIGEMDQESKGRAHFLISLVDDKGNLVQ